MTFGVQTTAAPAAAPAMTEVSKTEWPRRALNTEACVQHIIMYGGKRESRGDAIARTITGDHS